MPGIAFILPLYNKFAYGRRAASSFFRHTPTELNPFCIAVDDASPYYSKQDWKAWHRGLPQSRMIFQLFAKNAGLTRSWNWGLGKADTLGCDYAIAGNSDVLFAPYWYEGLLHHLNHGFHLVGPVTNAPGPTNKGKQRVQNYVPGYKVSDDADDIRAVAEYLREHRPLEEIVESGINGFFLMAKTKVWWSGAFDKVHVFNPRNRMVHQEDHLQRRWRKLGRKIGFVPQSFVFHYRAVSRGNRYKHGSWFRLDPNDLNKAV